MLASGRPDKFCISLLEGTVGLLIEGLPVAYGIPAVLSNFFRTSDDYSQNFVAVSFIRLLRYSAAALTLLLPAFYIAMVLGMKCALALSVLFLLMCTLLTTQFTEVNYFKQNRQTDEGSEIKHTYNILRDASVLLLSKRGLLIVALLSVFVIGTAGMLDEYDQLIAKGYGLNLGFIGVWGGFRYILEGIGSRIAYKLRFLLVRIGIKDKFFAIWMICLFAAISLGISGWTGSILLMPLYGLFYLVMASARILHEDYVQQKIEEQGRSTVHSIISLVDNVYGVGFFGVFALILSQQRVFSILVIVAVYIIAVCFLLGVMYIHNRRQVTL